MILDDSNQVVGLKSEGDSPMVRFVTFLHLRKYPNFSWPWSENLKVEDIGDEPLPETLFLVIHLDGCYFSDHTWKNSYGGSSWYPHKVFVSCETALGYIKDKDAEWDRYWVVPVRRFQ